jgi:hypothetical protein
MGSHRTGNSVRQEEAVHRSVKEKFNVSEKELYKCWIAFSYCAVKNMSPNKIIEKLRANTDLNPNALEYFCWIGLELVSNDIIISMNEEKDNGRTESV